MNIGLCQMDIAWEDKARNKEKISKLLEAHSGPALEWLIFPETTLSGFSMQAEKTTLTEEDLWFFRNMAISRKMFVTFGGVQADENSCITFDPSGQLCAVFSKLHPFSPDGEHEAYRAGGRAITFPVGDLRVTPMICYDLRFANVFWRKGPDTDVFVVIANWPSIRVDAWSALLAARAAENQCFTIGVNRTGASPVREYPGRSAAFDPSGACLLDCGNAEGIFTVQVLPETVAQARDRLPTLKDRRDSVSYEILE